MKFNVLGRLEIVTDDNRSFQLSASKTAQVLALLLARNQETVSVDTLIEELWHERPPRSALTTLQTYIYHGRRMFARERLISGSAEDLLVTRPPGYAIQVADEQLDAKVFENLVQQSRTHLDQGRPEIALSLLKQALDLWRGPAFASVTIGPALSAHVTHLAELQIRAIQLRIEAERRLGRYQELIPELRSLVVTHPLNELFHAQLIEALYKSGRRAEALDAYQSLRIVLDRELGVDPSPEVQRLQYEVLEYGRSGRALDHAR